MANDTPLTQPISVAEIPDWLTFLELNDRRSGVGSLKHISPGSEPSMFNSDEENKAITNVMRDQQVLRKTYDKLLTKRAEALITAPPTLGEAESVLGPQALGRTPTQLVSGGVPAFDELTGGMREITPPFAGGLPDLTAALNPLQMTAFEPMVKQLAERRFAAPTKPELKTVGNQMFAVSPETATAQPVTGLPEIVDVEKIPVDVQRELMRMRIDPSKSTETQRQQAAQSLAVGEGTKSFNQLAVQIFKKPVQDLTESTMDAGTALEINSRLKEIGLDPIAKLGMPALDVLSAIQKEQTAKQEGMIRASTAQAGKDIALAQPVPPERRQQMFDRKAFTERGELVRPPGGITEKEAATKDLLVLSDQQLNNWAKMQASAGSIKTIFDLADKLITAPTVAQAGSQYIRLHAGAITGANPDASAYAAGKEAFTSTTARTVGLESGVLTNQDVYRWERTLPSFGDTVHVKNKKREIFGEILGKVMNGNRRILGGDDPAQVQKKVRSELEPLLSQADTLATKPKQMTDEEILQELKRGRAK